MLVEIDDKLIDEQGERMVPAFHQGALVYGEHLTRYESVVDLIKDKVVLDIASGSGYGSYIMAEKAKKVYGVDIDRESVAYAKKNYGRSNIEFLQGSAETIPLENHSADTVVTFETVEHIKKYHQFLREIKRVLKPGGLVIVSTPNDTEFSENNHFHWHEFKYKELHELLGKYFKNVQPFFQYTWLFVGLMGESDASHEGNLNIDVSNLNKLPKEKAIYFLAICSDGPIDSLKLKKIGALAQPYSARTEQVNLKRLNDTIKNAEKAFQEEKQRAASFGQDLKNARNELKQVYSSRGWRLLTKFYGFKKALSEAFRRK